MSDPFTERAGRTLSGNVSQAVFALLALALGLGAGLLARAGAQEPPPLRHLFFTIATGSTVGTYFPVGDLLAAIISHPENTVRCEAPGTCGPEGLIAVAEASAGSVRNIELVQAGWVSSALAQADVVYRAAEAEAAAGSPSGLRAIAALYPERLHLVASEESGIHTLADLAGKRVSIDVPGSGTHANARLLLAALGLEEGELELSSLNADEAADAILFGTIDAYFLMAGAPVRSIEELLLLGLAHLVPVEGEVVAGLDAAHLFLGRSEIPAGTYPHQSAMPTLHVRAVWVVPAGADGDLIHAITRALWAPRNRAMLDQGHAVGREITLETATENLPVPLHPGAERFYMEAGLLGGAEPDTGSSPAPAAVR